MTTEGKTWQSNIFPRDCEIGFFITENLSLYYCSGQKNTFSLLYFKNHFFPPLSSNSAAAGEEEGPLKFGKPPPK